MNANEASTSDNKVAFGRLEAFQSLVGSFAQVVVVQAADLGKWLFVYMGAHCGIPNKKLERAWSSFQSSVVKPEPK